MMYLDYFTVEVRKGTLYRAGVIPHRELNLNIAIRYCDVGQWELTLPARSAMADLLAQPGSGIVVSYRGEVIFSGPMDYTEYTSNSDGDWLRKYSGPCDNVILADMLLWPAPGEAIDGQKRDAYPLNYPPYRNLTTYVHANSSNWTGVASRRRHVANGGLYVKGAYTAVSTDGYGSPESVFDELPGSPTNVSYSARFTPALEMAQAMEAAGSGPFEVRYEEVPIDENGTIAPRSVLRPQRLIETNGSVRFDVRNLEGVESTGSKMGAPTVTAAVVGGVGQLAYRTFVYEVADYGNPDIYGWRRIIEKFEDDRNTADKSKLRDAAAELFKDGAKTQIEQSLELTNDTKYEYMVDFTLGSIARIVEQDGVEREARIEGVAITADSDGLRCGIQIGKTTDVRTQFESRLNALERHEFAPPSTWADISPQNGWTHVSFMNCKWRVSSGEFQMQGAVKGGPLGTVFTLPEDLRPRVNQSLIAPSGTGFARIFVEAVNGNVNVDGYVSGGNNSSISLATVRYYLD